jgi:hypothetical protein
MSEFYYFNKHIDDKGRHEVHTENCNFIPHVGNREYIGYFSNSIYAIHEAQRKYPYKKFDGCYFCCNETHKG